MTNRATSVLDEILELVTRAFSRDVAEALVNLRASHVAQDRIAELAQKCSEGRLTPAERSQYESYVNAVDLVIRPSGQGPRLAGAARCVLISANEGVIQLDDLSLPH